MSSRFEQVDTLVYAILMFIFLGYAGTSQANETIEQEKTMSAKGKFEVNLELQNDDVAPAGRMLINKSYSGGLEGSGVGQMISKRTENGVAVYYAIEEFTGKVDGKIGSFTLVHKGVMNKDSESLEVLILDGSGAGELESIAGSMIIIQEGGVHAYELKYDL